MGIWLLAVSVAAAGSDSKSDLRGRLDLLRARGVSADALVELHVLYGDALRSGKRGSQILGEILLELDRYGDKASEFSRVPDERTRAAAAWALGVTASPRAAEALERLLADKRQSVRRSVVDALGQLATQEAIAVLKVALRDESEDLRLGSLKTIEALDPGWVAQEMGSFLEDPSEKVVHEALRFAAKNWAESSQAPGLVEAAASALGRLPEAEEVLVLAGEKASGVAVRALAGRSTEAAEAATRVLARLGAGGAVEELARTAREAERPLALAASEALARLGNTGALIEIARSGGSAAETAIIGMGQAKRSDEIVSYLVSHIDTGGDLARAAAESLAALDARGALPELARMAESDDLADAIEAVKAMVAMGDRSKTGVLLSRLSAPKQWDALRAAAALVRLGNVCGLPMLIGALDDEDRIVRAYASTALAGTVDSGIEFPIDCSEDRRRKLARMWRIWWETHKRTVKLREDD